ncbi:NAD-P-binding protein [Trametes gibbosa]|nr:NAD-P-binding protein [Trametes gibbosa]
MWNGNGNGNGTSPVLLAAPTAASSSRRPSPSILDVTIYVSLKYTYRKGWKPPYLQQPTAPGKQFKLNPAPLDDVTADGKPYKTSGKLEGRKALITGADSGSGRSVALLFALEGADLTLTYLPGESQGAQDMIDVIEKKTNNPRKLNAVELDLRKEENCKNLVKTHLALRRTLDALVLNHGTQNANIDLPSLPTEQWHDKFDTNTHSFFYICKVNVQAMVYGAIDASSHPLTGRLPHLEEGSAITFNASINMAVGHPELIDYTATKGAMIGFMRALSNQILGDKGVRCNAVAPGHIWTPLIPATMTKDAVDKFGTTVPIGRAGQPIEVATAFLLVDLCRF